MRRRNFIKLVVFLIVLGFGIPILFNYNFVKSISESEKRRLARLSRQKHLPHDQDFEEIVQDFQPLERGLPVPHQLQHREVDKKVITQGEVIKKVVSQKLKNEPPAYFDIPETRQKFNPPVLTPGQLGNYEMIERYNPGPGEKGKPVYTKPEQEGEVNRGFGDMGFNKVVSEMISLNRTIPDVRPNECKHWNYAEKLPTASVILIFLNEGWTTLLRTVHSVYNRSPPHLLKEIILLDDYSNKPFLAKPLEDYVNGRFNGKVKVFRNEKREGLIRARTNGAKHATGDVIIFLDSHCEVNTNWLPPLLATILHNPRTLAAPVFDGIDDTTFEYRETYSALHRGIFEWGFFYKENAVPAREQEKRKHWSEPYRSPTHAGGLFAIGRKYFFELGGYDPHLETWGGENFEISFKLWQCGGEQVWVPCSHVGHIYSVRAAKPYSNRNLFRGISNTEMNYLRVVETWFDPEHKEYFYTRVPHLRGCPVPNLEDQLKFKVEHNCKNFTWFMKEIAYDVYDKFPPPPKNIFWGQFVMKAENEKLCWDAGRGNPMLYSCHPQNSASQNQIYRLNAQGQIGNGERCVIAKSNSKLEIAWCELGSVSGPWTIDSTHLIRNTQNGQCVSGRNNVLYMRDCDPNDEYQQWSSRESFPWKLQFPDTQ